MKLIVGLGNPGGQYRNTLHNVGFQVVDLLAERLNASHWNQKFRGDFIRGKIGINPYGILKPLTFMNISGESVLPCKQFFKLELEDILVISDDIDRPLGTLRYRKSGGHGGHNGLRSIVQLCGGTDFHRIKVGIGRPGNTRDVSSYVLSSPTPEMVGLIRPAIEQTTEHLMDFLKGTTIQIA
jgi:peptidyl-tRNA hydrolase, PTH1 family